jgi:hypothetical protein
MGEAAGKHSLETQRGARRGRGHPTSEEEKTKILHADKCVKGSEMFAKEWRQPAEDIAG